MPARTAASISCTAAGIRTGCRPTCRPRARRQATAWSTGTAASTPTTGATPRTATGASRASTARPSRRSSSNWRTGWARSRRRRSERRVTTRPPWSSPATRATPTRSTRTTRRTSRAASLTASALAKMRSVVMTERTFLFTSESVTEGHPDKIADQISDAVLDAALANDPLSRVACETLITTGLIVVAGEMTTDHYIDIPRIARETVKNIGYTRAKYGFDAETCGVIVALDEQSPDIAQGVDQAYEVQHSPGDEDPLDKVGAGDQGMMFGYASNETRELMPLPIMLAHRITKRLSEVRKADVLPYLRPDGKAQVSVRYEVDADGRQRPVEIERVLVSTQHREGLDAETMIKPDLVEHVLRPILPRDLYDERRLDEPGFVYVNPTGKFVIGGPMGDTGLTGRKIIVDTYGGAAPHGGGAFSGKDPTKVDRSAAYAARYVAKNVVAAGLADRCQIQVAYAIGVAKPFSVLVETFGTEHVPVATIEALVTEHFARRPAAILQNLELRRPIYSKTAAYGHFGREDHDFTWERTDKAAALRDAAGLAAATA